MIPGLSTFAHFLSVAGLLDQGDKNLARLLRAAENTLQDAIAPVQRLELYRQYGHKLFHLASTTDDDLVGWLSVDDDALLSQAIATRDVIASDDQHTVAFAPLIEEHPKLVLRAQFETTINLPEVAELFAAITDGILAGVERRSAQVLVNRVGDITRRLTHARTFTEIAGAISQGFLRSGQYVSMNFANRDENGEISGFYTLATANRHRSYAPDFTIEVSLVDAGEPIRDVFERGRYIQIQDFQSAEITPGLKFSVSGRPVQSVVAFPMISSDTVIGTIIIHDLEAPLDFSREELDLLQKIIDQVTTHVTLLNLIEESAQSRTISERQAAVFNQLIAGQSMVDMARVVARYMLPEGDRRLAISEIARSEPNQIDGWQMVAMVDSERAIDLEPHMMLAWNDLGRTVQNRIIDNEDWYIDDVAEVDPAQLGEGLIAWLSRNDVQSLMFIPIASAHQPIAVMMIMSTRRQNMTRTEITALRNIVDQIGALIDVNDLRQSAEAAQKAVENLVLANRLITAASTNGYMAQAIMYTLGRDMAGAYISLFDDTLNAGESPNVHQIVGFSTVIDVVDFEPAIAGPSLSEAELRRLISGLPVFPDENAIEAFVPDAIAQSLVKPASWVIVFGLRRLNNLIGTLVLIDDQPHDWDEERISAYTNVADHIGLVIRSRQLLAESRKIQSVAAQLVQANQSVASADDYGAMGQVILRLFPDAFIGVALSIFDEPATPEQIPASVDLLVYVSEHGVQAPEVTDAVDVQTFAESGLIKRLLEGRLLTVDDLTESQRTVTPDGLQFLLNNGITSVIIVGMRSGQRLIGLMTLAKSPDVKVNPLQYNNIQAIADQAAVTVENRNLLKQTSEALGLTHKQFDVANILFRSTRPELMLAAVYNMFSDICPNAHMALFDQTDGDGKNREDVLRIVARTDDMRIVPADEPISVEQYLGLKTLLRGEVVIADNIPRSNELSDDDKLFLMGQGYRTIVLLPLRTAGGRLLGALQFTHESPTHIPQNRLLALQTVAEQMTVALENRLLLQTAQEASQALRGQIRVLETINSINARLTGTLDEYALFERACNALYDALPFDQISVALLDEERSTLHVVSEHPAEETLSDVLVNDANVRPHLMKRKSSLTVRDLNRSTFLVGATKETLQAKGIKSLLVLPIMDTDNALTGAFAMTSTHQDMQISDDMINVASTIVSQIEVILQNIRLLQDSQRQARQMEQIAGFIQSIQSTLDIPTLLEIALISAREVVPADHRMIVLYDHQIGHPRVAAEQDALSQITVNLSNSEPIDLSMTSVGKVWRDQEALFVTDLNATDLHHAIEPELRSTMAFPLFARGALTGVFEMSSSFPNAYTMTDRAVMQQLASQLAVAIETADSYQQSQRIARSKALVNEIAAKLQQQMEIDQILNVTMNELGDALGARRARIRLSLADGDMDNTEGTS